MDHRIDQLRQRLREDPSSRQFFQLGELLRKEGKIEEATGVLSAGLEHFPRYVAAWLSLGRAELNREMFDDAELAFSKALELDPANGAAARMLGETALARGDWLKAHKSFKFASALAPQDEEIEKALARVEAQLAEAGQEPGYDTQDLIEEVASQYRKTLEVEVEPEPHIVGDEEDPFGETPPPVERPIPQVYTVSDDDPFETGSPGDSGEWDEPDDVFAFDQQSAAVEDSVQPEVAPESEDVFAAEAVSESSHEPTEDFEVRAEPQPEEPEPKVEQPPVNDVPAEPEATSAPPGGLPFPTVTLAQLAFEQGDHALAEKTLLEVLQRDPESAQARDLLTEVARAVSGEVHQAPAESGQDLVSRKIDRLHSWLGGIRLAAEQRVL